MFQVSLKCITSIFDFSCIKNSFSFGNLEKANEQFHVHIDDFEIFFQLITNVLEAHYSGNLQRKTFLINDIKGHTYDWQIVAVNNIQNQTSHMIKLLCLNSNQETNYFLLFTFRQFVQLIKCFHFSIFFALPIESNAKLWLKYCCNIDIEEMKHNQILLMKETKTFSTMLNLSLDPFFQVEIFQYFYPLILCYINIRKLLQNLEE